MSTRTYSTVMQSASIQIPIFTHEVFPLVDESEVEAIIWASIGKKMESNWNLAKNPTVIMTLRMPRHLIGKTIYLCPSQQRSSPSKVPVWALRQAWVITTLIWLYLSKDDKVRNHWQVYLKRVVASSGRICPFHSITLHSQPQLPGVHDRGRNLSVAGA